MTIARIRGSMVLVAAVLLASLGASLLAIVGYARYTDQSVAAYEPLTSVDNTTPAGFLPAPNPVPLCASPAYFAPWQSNVDAVENGINASVLTDTTRNADEGGVVATFTTTQQSTALNSGLVTPAAFGGTGASIGIVFQGATAAGELPAKGKVTLSEPLFYSQWVFTDADLTNEGFQTDVTFANSTPGGVGVYTGSDTYDFTGTDADTARFSRMINAATQGFDVAARGQADFFGAITELDMEVLGIGGAGFAAGSGCEPIGVAKSASAPTWDPATETFSVDYTINVINNLPTTETLQANIAAAQASAGGSSVVGSPQGIDITTLVLLDQLDLTGFGSSTISNLASAEFEVNSGYDGVADTALLAPDEMLGAESSGTVTFTVDYVPDFTDAAWQGCSATVANQAFGSGDADGVPINDESDDGLDPAPTATNGNTGTDDPSLITFDLQCGIDLTKDLTAGPTSNGDGTYDVEYTLVATNTGTAPVTGVVIDDDLAAAFGADLVSSSVTSDTCADVTLSANDTCEKVVSAVITSTTGLQFENTGSVSAVAPGGDPLTSEAVAPTEILENPNISLDKDAGPVVNNGDGTYTVEYTLKATNTGDTTLTSVSIVDDLETAYGAALESSTVVSDGCVDVTLNVGDSCTKVISVVFTPGASTAAIDNIATASGVSPGGVTVEATDDETVNPPGENPEISLVKSAAPGELVVDAEVAYTFVVTNTGDIVLNEVSVSDSLIEAISCPMNTLPVGESMVCTGTHTVTQAEVDAGTIMNTADTSGVSPGGTTVTDTDTVEFPVPHEPSIDLVKSASTGELAVDVEVEYTFDVTNNGTVSLTGVSVSDDLLTNVTCPKDALVVDETMQCTGTYTITQADVDAGAVMNTASTTGTAPDGQTVSDEDSVEYPLPQDPSIDLVKSASTGELAVGVEVEYTFDVTNNGTVSLVGVSVSDDLLTNVTCPKTALAVDETMQCTGTYTITQADVDAGAVMNTASTTGTAPDGQTVSDTDSVTYPLPQEPSIDLVKSASPGELSVGTVVTYTFDVTNTGTVSLTEVAVTDDLLTDITCPTSRLAPGDSTRCTGSYTITQADVDAGAVMNTASTTGTAPTGKLVSDEDSVEYPVPQEPSIDLVKSASTGELAVGVEVEYTFDVTNNGTVSLTGVSVSDDLLTNVTCPKTALAVDETMQCTGSYTITQADVDAGAVMNTASTTGTAPDGQTVSDEDSVEYPLEQGPAIELVKDFVEGDFGVGDVVEYTFVATNVGNVTLEEVVVSDSLVAEVTCPVSELAVGESVTCTGSYTLTQADVDAGGVNNTASVEALGLGTKEAVNDDSLSQLPLAGEPAIGLVKTARPGDLVAGAKVVYDFAVTNTGNVSLSDVALDDPLLSDETCPKDELEVGETMQCSGTYTVTAADVAAGEVMNTATVSGVGPDGTEVKATDTAEFPLPPKPMPGMLLDKKLHDGVLVEGQTLTYAIIVYNTGNVVLSDIVVSDSLTDRVSCPKTALAAGESMACTALYVATAADVAAGRVVNTATATALDPDGNRLTLRDTEYVYAKPKPVPPTKPKPVPPTKPTKVPPPKPTPSKPVPPVKVPKKPGLAVTGANAAPMTVAGVALIGVGVGLVFVDRRKHRSQA